MKITIHENYVKKYDPRAGTIKKEFIGLTGCKACKKRCRYCKEPFTLSTALLEEDKFCSMYCELQYDSTAYNKLMRKIKIK